MSRDDAQILCYPGLKLQSLLHLFNFFKYGPDSPNPGRKPRKVVISCGLNDKTLAPSTTNVALGKIINKAKRIFPGSEIYLAQITFSLKLPISEQNNLKIMNDKIKSLATQQTLNTSLVFRPTSSKSAVTIFTGQNIAPLPIWNTFSTI